MQNLPRGKLQRSKKFKFLGQKAAHYNGSIVIDLQINHIMGYFVLFCDIIIGYLWAIAIHGKLNIILFVILP